MTDKKNQRYALMVGVEFNNQGAYLMLRAMADEIRTRFSAVPVVAWNNGSAVGRAVAGVSELLPRRVSTRLDKVGVLRSGERLFSRTSLVLTKDVAAVFDASGFAYGDQWRDSDLSIKASRLAYWKQREVPVYMMPQAFGPFEHTAAPARTAVESSALVFARDPASADYLSGILTPTAASRVIQSPDFTLGVRGSFPRGLERYAGHVPIVPNWNIYMRAEQSQRELYIDNLSWIVTELRRRGFRPYGLAHEGNDDVRVLEIIRARVGKLDVVRGLNGIELKGLIGTAPLLISGRFHAIVSGLAQAVPTIIHGWSHKYRYLAEDFGVPSLVADPLGSRDANAAALDFAVGGDKLRGDIAERAAILKSRATTMWQQIGDDLASKNALMSSGWAE
jgi:polysaccharide pyruvyl transferase WcaK-like protein